MKAIVVYESLWGNTEAIARAVASGLGPGTQVLSTAQATASTLAGADLIVAGAPLIAFTVPTDKMLKTIGQSRESVAPDLSQPAMATWLSSVPKGSGHSATFETRLWWSPGSATKTMGRELESAGYLSLAKAQRFIVKGKCGPLRGGEVERARLWGAELAVSAGRLLDANTAK
jgi:hypothetical protein